MISHFRPHRLYCGCVSVARITWPLKISTGRNPCSGLSYNIGSLLWRLGFPPTSLHSLVSALRDPRRMTRINPFGPLGGFDLLDHFALSQGSSASSLRPNAPQRRWSGCSKFTATTQFVIERTVAANRNMPTTRFDPLRRRQAHARRRKSLSLQRRIADG